MDGAAVDRDDGVRASARRRVELPGVSVSERCSWRLRVAERIEATVLTRRARRPAQPEHAPPRHLPVGDRPRHGSTTMRSSGGEAARGSRVRMWRRQHADDHAISWRTAAAVSRSGRVASSWAATAVCTCALQGDDLVPERVMDGAAVDRDDGVRASARRRVELPGASGSERGNWRLRGGREDRGHGADQADAATGAAGACAAVTLAGRGPVPAWRRDDAVERRRSRAMTASPSGTRCAADDFTISASMTPGTFASGPAAS